MPAVPAKQNVFLIRTDPSEVKTAGSTEGQQHPPVVVPSTHPSQTCQEEPRDITQAIYRSFSGVEPRKDGEPKIPEFHRSRVNNVKKCCGRGFRTRRIDLPTAKKLSMRAANMMLSQINHTCCLRTGKLFILSYF